MAANITIGSGERNAGEVLQLRAHYQDRWEDVRGGGGESEIEEDLSIEVFGVNNGSDGVCNSLGTIREDAEESVFSYDFHRRGEDVVYVVVGKQREAEAMDALVWTVNNAVVNKASTVVFLVYVFPETKFIPSPLGNLPISQVNPERKEMYMAQERGKRREFLQKFLNVCSASQVKVDTILIESEMEAKAILDLIPILNISKLVIGATKSSVRRMRSRKGSGGVVDEILRNAPEFCEVKIVCEGKEISLELTTESSSSHSPSPRAPNGTPKFDQEQEQTKNDSFSYGCFKISSSSHSPSPRAPNGTPKFDQEQEQTKNDSFSYGCFKICFE